MTITVKGVEVRPKEVEKEIEVNFDDLTEKGQKRLFLEHPEEFVEDALKSKYMCMPRLVLKDRDKLSENALNKAIKVLIEKKAYENIILKFLEVPFELNEEIRELLFCRWRDDKLQLWLAKDTKYSPKLLKRKFLHAIYDFVDHNETQLFDAVVTNPNFKMDEDIEREIKERFSPVYVTKIMARVEELKK